MSEEDVEILTTALQATGTIAPQRIKCEPDRASIFWKIRA